MKGLFRYLSVCSLSWWSGFYILRNNKVIYWSTLNNCVWDSFWAIFFPGEPKSRFLICTLFYIPRVREFETAFLGKSLACFIRVIMFIVKSMKSPNIESNIFKCLNHRFSYTFSLKTMSSPQSYLSVVSCIRANKRTKPNYFFANNENKMLVRQWSINVIIYKL